MNSSSFRSRSPGIGTFLKLDCLSAVKALWNERSWNRSYSINFLIKFKLMWGAGHHLHPRNCFDQPARHIRGNWVGVRVGWIGCMAVCRPIVTLPDMLHRAPIRAGSTSLFSPVESYIPCLPALFPVAPPRFSLGARGRMGSGARARKDGKGVGWGEMEIGNEDRCVWTGN